MRSRADEAWNTFFLGQGWLVVRFSLQQVTAQPQSCCRAIAQVLHQLLADPLLLKPFEEVPELVPMPRWTEAEARQMLARERVLSE
ncbi:hypothetical protein DO97_14845 [Neosynechococcus sphagnicola sy1]|uniref:DUF559 domain-containing protein n=1 Tax=Neosynechococcus sphagnicola sy1 TaxID=1497020 RepID=A0A098TIL7_9CYAN|nr:hypothetical protein DO97_14845 [Neosynechococcus sphagnicola sy1]